MPGIFVDVRDDDLLEVEVPYHQPYLNRIRRIDGAYYEQAEDGDSKKGKWLIPIESAADLDEEFEGELIYKSPRHDILDIDPPKPPKIYKNITRFPIADLNPKYPPHDYQLFGANFMVWSMLTQRIAIIGDLMG